MAWLKKLNPFNDLNAETKSSWNTAKVEEWKTTSKTMLKGYFCEFRGSQFVPYSLPGSRKALKFRILYALYGPPKENEATTVSNDYKDYPSDYDVGYHIEFSRRNSEDDVEFIEVDEESSETESSLGMSTIEEDISDVSESTQASSSYFSLEDDEFPLEFDVYNETKKKAAESFIKIIESLTKYQQTNKSSIYIGIFFISCKQEGCDDYLTPIFSLLKPEENPQSPRAQRYFIDKNGRIYDGWDDWKKNNTMPMLKYAYPKFGYYTTDEFGGYEFDPNKELSIEFGNSPQCSMKSKLFQSGENVSSIGGLACSVVIGASIFTPIGAITLATTGGLGLICGAYSGARSVNRIIDKIEHKENFKNLESAILVCSIVALPLSLVGSGATMMLARGAQMERSLFTSANFKTFVTLINITNCSFDGFLVCMSVANLYDKYKKDELTALDVLHFSMSLFFFTNTLIRPKMANKIIAESQRQNIDSLKMSMSDERAREVLQTKYLNKNQDTAKVVRNLKNIQNHEQFFASIGDDVKKIKISGKHNQKVLLIKDNGKVKNVNLRTYESKHPTAMNTMNEFGRIKNIQALREQKGLEPKDYVSKFATTGIFLFKLTQGNVPVNQICDRLLKHFNVNTGVRSAVCDVVRIVMQECRKRNSTNVNAGAENLLQNLNTFSRSLEREVETAKRIAGSCMLVFENDFKAYLLYKKYGVDFPTRLHNQTIHVWIEHSRDNVNKTTIVEEFEEVENFGNGVQRKVVQTILGKVTVSLKNFPAVEAFDSDGRLFDSHHKIQQYIRHPLVEEILQDLPRQVFDIMGIHSSNQLFYKNVPISLFWEGSLEGVSYSNSV